MTATWFRIINATLLFIALIAPGHFSQLSGSSSQQTITSVPLSQYDMTNSVGGEVTIVVNGNGDTLAWALAGGALGYIFAGVVGILPGALIGGILWAFFG